MSILDYIIKKIEQAETLLYSFKTMLEPLPVILMWINLIVHCMYIYIIWDYIIYDISADAWLFPGWFYTLHADARFFFETSCVTWVILMSQSKEWKTLAKGSLRFLFLFLVVNSIFILSNMETIGNLYFYALLSIVFLSFFLFAIFEVHTQLNAKV